MVRIFIVVLTLQVYFHLAAAAQEQHIIAIDSQRDAFVTFMDGFMEIAVQSAAGQTHSQQFYLSGYGLVVGVQAADYNGDGYADLSVQFDSQPNHMPTHWHIFLFQPEKANFQEVVIPEKYGNVNQSVGFLNPYFLEEERILFSHSDYLHVLQDRRNGYNRQGWKFTILGSVYLAESLRPVERDDPWTAIVPLTAVHTTFDEAGDTICSSAVFMFSPTEEMEPVVLPVEQKRLYLHDAPHEGKRSSMYLIHGDKYEVLDYLKGGWLKIRYVNPSQGNIDKYIKVMEASSDRLDFYREVVRENEGIELTIGDLGMGADSVYAALLYMGLENLGTYANQFDADGSYLLYRPKKRDEPYKIWQLASRQHTFPIAEVGKVSMWADNFVIWKQGKHILDGAIHSSVFLPTAIEDGDYEYRVVMTSARYDMALISNAATLKLPLPKVIWDGKQYVVQPLVDN